MKKINIFLQIILFFTIIKCNFAFFGKTNHFNTHDEPEIDLVDGFKSGILKKVQQKWISQSLDHFDTNEKRVWSMRYLENDEYLQQDGPIFIFVGGEWEISPGWILTGHMHDMAKEFNGSLFYTEHRYYGKSRPTPDSSNENLKYLTVQQALADLAQFIHQMKVKNPLLKNSKVFLVGGSYSATMVTWAKLKYPNLVTGGWASSAPLYAKMDFYEYNEVMTESIRIIGGEKCLRRIEDSFKKLEDLTATADDEIIEKITKNFNLCEKLNISRDTSHFFYEISDTFAGLVQKHRSGDIEKACGFILQEKFTSDVEAVGAWISNSFSKKNVSCVDVNYDKTVKKFSNATWDSEGNKQLRQWIYQTCDAFGWFQTANSIKHSFGWKYPQVDYFVKMCRDLYGDSFNHKTIQRNVHKINEEFGGLFPKVKNIYSTHGHLDPWKAMGTQDDLNESSPTMIIKSYSHVSDLSSISPRDTSEMKESKMRVRELIKSWL